MPHSQRKCRSTTHEQLDHLPPPHCAPHGAGIYAKFLSPMKSKFLGVFKHVVINHQIDQLKDVTTRHTASDGTPGRRISSKQIINTLQIEMDGKVGMPLINPTVHGAYCSRAIFWCTPGGVLVSQSISLPQGIFIDP